LNCRELINVSLLRAAALALPLERVVRAKSISTINHQQPRTLWYDDHGVHHTAENVYSGLAAQYHLIDPGSAPHPRGEYDVPLVISDAMFAADGSLMFDDKLHSGHWGGWSW
jgi:hypothetical protein